MVHTPQMDLDQVADTPIEQTWFDNGETQKASLVDLIADRFMAAINAARDSLSPSESADTGMTRREIFSLVAATGALLSIPSAAFAEAGHGDETLSESEAKDALHHALDALPLKHLETYNSVTATLSFARAIKEFLTNEHFTPKHWTAAVSHLVLHNIAQGSHAPESLHHLQVDVMYLLPVLIGTSMGDILEDMSRELGSPEAFSVDEDKTMTENMEEFVSYLFKNAHIAALSSGAYAIDTDKQYRSLIYLKFFKPKLDQYEQALSALRAAAQDDEDQRIMDEFIEGEFKELRELCMETLDEVKIREKMLALNEAYKEVYKVFAESSKDDDRESINTLGEVHDSMMEEMAYGVDFVEDDWRVSESAAENKKWNSIKFGHQYVRNMANLLGQMVIGDPPNFLLLADSKLSTEKKLQIQASALASVIPVLTADAEKTMNMMNASFDQNPAEKAKNYRGVVKELASNFTNAYKVTVESLIFRLIGKDDEGRPKPIDHLLETKLPILAASVNKFFSGVGGSLLTETVAAAAKADAEAIAEIQEGEPVASQYPDMRGRKGNRFLVRALMACEPGQIQSVLEDIVPADQAQSVYEAMAGNLKRLGLDVKHDEDHADHSSTHEHHIDWGDLRLVEVLAEKGVDPNVLRVRLAQLAMGGGAGVHLSGKRKQLREIYGRGSGEGLEATAKSWKDEKVEDVLDMFGEYIHSVKEIIGPGTEEVLALVLLQVIYLQSIMPVVFKTIDGFVGEFIEKGEQGNWLENQETMPDSAFRQVVAFLITLCSASGVADNLAMFMACQKVLTKMSAVGLLTDSMYEYAIEKTYEGAIGFGALTRAGGPASAPQKDNPGNAPKEGAASVMANAISRMPLYNGLLKDKLDIDLKEHAALRVVVESITARGLQGVFQATDIFKKAGAALSKLSPVTSAASNLAGKALDNRLGSVVKAIIAPGDAVAEALIADSPENLHQEKVKEMTEAANTLTHILHQMSEQAA